MDIKTAASEAFKEMVIPKLREIRQIIQEMISSQQMINKRIDDMNRHLCDPNRKVDQVKNKNNQVSTELSKQIYALENRLTARIDAINKRLDKLHDFIVRREEHEELKKNLHAFNRRLKRVEEKVEVI